MGKLFDLEASGYFYSRLQNPTNDCVAAKITALEGGTAGIPAGLIRISCGLEDKKDLIADIAQAIYLRSFKIDFPIVPSGISTPKFSAIDAPITAKAS